MQKTRLPTIERVFVIIAVFTIFAVTFQQMSTDGVVPGNDPAVHLGKAKTIVMNERVSYSEVPWYPPLLHSIIAVLQIFAGTLDVLAAAFILKLLIATFNVLILLTTYLLARKLLGIGVAVVASVFTIVSIPLFEMIFWGGYANFMGLAYIGFVFYVMNRDLRISVKTLFLFLGTFTLILVHQLSAFVFVLMFVPAFLISSIGSRKKLLVFFAVIVGGGLAILAWYARILIEYSNIIIEHLFFTMEENVYHIPAVGIEALTKNFGITLYLALAGIPLTFILLRRKKALKSSVLIIFWVAVPFLLAQSYLFGIQLPYHRFVYFFATPLAILAAMAVYSLTKLPTFIITTVIPKIKKKAEIPHVDRIIALVLIIFLFSLFFIQTLTFVQRVETYPGFYEVASIPSYKAGLWLNQHSPPDGTVIVPKSPGSWFYIFSGRNTMEETDPVYSRNAVAEAVLYSFFEMENSRTLIHEYAPSSLDSGSTELCVSRFNIWTKVLNIPNSYVDVVYVTSIGGRINIPLSEAVEHTYWTKNSTEESQLVSEYVHELFIVKKVITFSSDSSKIRVDWKIEARQNLPKVKLTLNCYMEPSFDYKEALVPGILDWQNPWDNATWFGLNGDWAVVEGSSDNLGANFIATLDAQNGTLAAVEFDDHPDLFTLGALDNRFIDKLRFLYELGDLTEGEKREVSLSLFAYSFDFEEVERFSVEEMQQFIGMEIGLPVQIRDFLSYIEEYNIKFVVVDTQPAASENEAAPALDNIYSNGRAIIYTTKR